MAKAKKKWCGQIYAQDLRKMIKVVPKEGEDCGLARKRVAEAHLKGKPSNETPKEESVATP